MDDEPMRVLYVDDDPEFAELAATFLEREDDRLDVETVHDAETGIERIEELAVDCVVSDYDMPTTDGIEFLELVREHDEALPFILFTGKGSEEVASEAISAGVTDYLQKEHGVYTLLANRVVNAIEKFRIRREAERTRERLRRQNDLFEKAQQLATVGAWEYDLDDDDLYWTAEAKRIHGLQPDADPTIDEALSFFVGEDHDRITAAFEAACEAGEPYDLELRLRTAGGERRWVRTRGDPQYVDDEIVRLRGTIRDVTERRERERALRESKDRLQLLFEKAPEPMFVHDIDGRFTDVNEAAVERLGYDREELLSMRVPDIEVGPGSEDLDDMWAETEIGSYRRVDGRHRRADGTEFPVEVWVSPIEIEGEKRFLAIARDVSDR